MELRLRLRMNVYLVEEVLAGDMCPSKARAFLHDKSG